MIPQLTIPIVNAKLIPIRPFSDFLNYVSYHLVPQGAIFLFEGTVPKGYEEVTTLTPPTGFKYGRKS